ncbi:MAG: KH domain-containing protein [archaeon]
MTTFSYELKIPKERVAVLIGKNGEIKKRLEEDTDTRLKVDSKEGDVFVEGEDAIKLYTTREIILAVARGFNPETAMELLKSDYLFESINIQDFSRNKTDLLRIKGRIIGQDGKTRRIIEDLTETSISVYGKTVCIIGDPSNLSIARRAIEMLVRGSPHKKVYTWLEKMRSALKMRSMGLSTDD